jgi:hypothetical protein
MRATKTAIAVSVLVAFGLCLWTFKRAPVARAQNACSVSSLQGTYGLAVDGFFYDVDGFQGVYASAGVAVADGAGGITGTDTVNVDGTPTRGRKFTGTYTVNTDCSGNMVLKDSTGAPLTNMDMVVTNGGKDLVLVDYDPNLILHGTAKLE